MDICMPRLLCPQRKSTQQSFDITVYFSVKNTVHFQPSVVSYVLKIKLINFSQYDVHTCDLNGYLVHFGESGDVRFEVHRVVQQQHIADFITTWQFQLFNQCMQSEQFPPSSSPHPSLAVEGMMYPNLFPSPLARSSQKHGYPCTTSYGTSVTAASTVNLYYYLTYTTVFIH